MKKLLLSLSAMMLASGQAFAGVEGSMVSYFVQTSTSSAGTSTSSMDMVGIPIIGYKGEGEQDGWKYGGHVRLMLEEGEWDMLDQNITLENETVTIFFGHEEFMDSTLGSDHIVWIDHTQVVGAYGIVGREDILRVTLNGLGLRIDLGINPILDEASSETYTRTYTALNYSYEGDGIEAFLGVTSASDAVNADVSPSLVDSEFDGQSVSSVAAAFRYTMDKTSVAVNFEQGSTTAGTAGAEAVTEVTTSFVIDHELEAGGITLNLGSHSLDDGTANPTASTSLDLTYKKDIAEGLNCFVSYGSTSVTDSDDGTDETESETGIGFFYEY